jgi:hypothetical protein
LLRPLNRQPGDLHGFDFQRAALQRGGGIEIFVNFAGGAGQVSLIAAGGDGAEFIQRQLRVIALNFSRNWLIDRSKLGAPASR